MARVGVANEAAVVDVEEGHARVDDDNDDKANEISPNTSRSALHGDDEWLEQNARSFPVFSGGGDSDEQVRYRAYNRRHMNYMYYGPLQMALSVVLATQFNLENLFRWPPSSPLLAVCGTGFVVNQLLVILLQIPFILRLFGFVALADSIEGRIEPLPLEEITLLLGLAAAGGVTIARTLAGQCPAGTSAWATQACNPLADVGGRPLDDMMLVMLAPVAIQKCMKNVRLPALLAAWAVITLVVVFNLAWAKAKNSYTSYAIVPYLVIAATISMEIERIQRVHYKHWLRGKELALVSKQWLAGPTTNRSFDSLFPHLPQAALQRALTAAAVISRPTALSAEPPGLSEEGQRESEEEQQRARDGQQEEQMQQLRRLQQLQQQQQEQELRCLRDDHRQQLQRQQQQHEEAMQRVRDDERQVVKEEIVTTRGVVGRCAFDLPGCPSPVTSRHLNSCAPAPCPLAWYVSAAAPLASISRARHTHG